MAVNALFSSCLMRGDRSRYRFVAIALALTAWITACSDSGDGNDAMSGSNSPPSAPTVSLSAIPTSVVTSGFSTLIWSSMNATSCSASDGWVDTRSTSGSTSTGVLNATSTFTLTCTGAGGSASSSVTVAVLTDGYGSLSIPSLDDERNTYRGWGWSWTTDEEPSAVSEPIANYAVVSPDIHGDTEGDDLWTYLMMYRRSGNPVYLNRAQAWASYFKTKYRASPEFSVDDGFLLDHLYGWGLFTWYEHTCQSGACDTAALIEAENLAAVSETHWSTRSNKSYPVPGQFRMAFYSVREGARHLLLVTRAAEVTGNPRWVELRDRLIDLWLQSPDWDARGMYFFGDAETNNYLGIGSYEAGARIVSPFQIGILAEAFDQAYQTTGRTELRGRLVAMAKFIDQYGLDPGCQYTGYRFGIRDDKPWHSYTDGNTSSCTAGHWDSSYTTSLVNVLVRGYKYTGDTRYYDRAKYFFNRGTKGIYGNPTTRTALDTEVHHFVDTRFDSSSGNFFMNYNKGELQYTYLLFEYPHP